MFEQGFRGYFAGETHFRTHAAQQIHLGVSLREAIATELPPQSVKGCGTRPDRKWQTSLYGEVHLTSYYRAVVPHVCVLKGSESLLSPVFSRKTAALCTNAVKLSDPTTLAVTDLWLPRSIAHFASLA